MEQTMIKFWAAGFDDQLPCARNRYNFGIGAILFTNKQDADDYVAGKVISVREFSAPRPIDLRDLIGQQRTRYYNHLVGLGVSDETLAKELAQFDQRTRG